MKTDLQQRIDKLPKWAQDHIRVLSSRLRGAQSEAARLMGDKPSSAYWESYADLANGGRPKKMYLPGGRATFIIGQDRYGRTHEISVDVTATNEGVQGVDIHCTQTFMRIAPLSCNRAHITTLDPRDSA